MLQETPPMHSLLMNCAGATRRVRSCRSECDAAADSDMSDVVPILVAVCLTEMDETKWNSMHFKVGTAPSRNVHGSDPG